MLGFKLRSMSDGYQGLSSPEKWGCISAAAVGVPIFLFLLGADALGDCAPDTNCRKGFLLMVLIPSVIVTAVAFLVVRSLLGWLRKRDR